MGYVCTESSYKKAVRDLALLLLWLVFSSGMDDILVLSIVRNRGEMQDKQFF